MTTKKNVPADNTNGRTFLGHPRALTTICSIEIWERFSFYGMQGILLIYLYHSVAEGGLGIAQPIALGLMGAYSSGVYLSTIIGAWCADRLLGGERTLFYSGCTVMCGHIVLALLPGVLGLSVGLLLIALGSGGVKATTSSMLGSLYEDDRERRDAGFSIYYLCVNLGALVGPTLTGILQSDSGFHYGFGLAAIGMALGLFLYARGRKGIPPRERFPHNPLKNSEKRGYGIGAVIVLILIAAGIACGWIHAENLDHLFLIVIVIAAVAYFAGMLISPSVSAVERRQVLIFIPIFIASVVFFALYFQMFTVVTVIFDQQVDRFIGQWQMPVAWLSSMEALFIIILSLVFAWIWTSLGPKQPSSTIKFVLALIILAVSYAGYIPFLGGESKIPLWLPLLLLIIYACAEMCISPIGLSLSTKLAPQAFKTQMVALFMLSLAMGFSLGGSVGSYYNHDSAVTYFTVLVVVGIVAGLLLLCFFPLIKRGAPKDY